MRSAWRFLSAAALFLAGAAILLSVVLYLQVQSDRESNIRRNCVSSNERHDDTVKTLDRLVAQVPADRRQRARDGRSSTVALIDALAPKRDCDRVVEQQLHGP